MEKLIHFRIAEIFKKWDSDFLQAYGIEKVGSVFLFDREKVTRTASTQPSYFGHFLYYKVYTKFEKGSPEEEKAYKAVLQELSEDDYFSEIPEGHSFAGFQDEDETYEEAIQDQVGYLQVNQPL